MQCYEMQRKSDSFCPTYGKQAVQCSENVRNSLGLNYNQLLYHLSYAGKNAAHIDARHRLKQVADLTNVSAS
jgi:hypothetical protein